MNLYTTMNTYTIQQSRHSGETYGLTWDDDTLVAICGPLTPEEQEQAIADIDTASSWEWEDATGMGDTPEDWQPPIATWEVTPPTRDDHDDNYFAHRGMICEACGVGVEEGDRFCAECGFHR